MARLASVFYNKFIKMKNHIMWAKVTQAKSILSCYLPDYCNKIIQVIRSIISKFRKKGDDGPRDTITPSEFLRYNKTICH